MKTLLFIIDMQNDFCRPTGNLYVPGAENDVMNLCLLITRKMKVIDKIILTQDSHQVMDIVHSCFWVNADGKYPQPFTVITFEDVMSGKWTPLIYKTEIMYYLQQLEAIGDYSHTIWPAHCIWGSEGAAINTTLMQKIGLWARQGRLFEIITKGLHPLTDSFGAFIASLPLPNAPETQYNMSLLQELSSYDTIWIAGEAKSHCVAHSIKQPFVFPELMQKITILEDCMSNVSGYENSAGHIFAKAEKLGARLTTSKDIV